MIHKLEKSFTGKGSVKGHVFERVKDTDYFYIYKVTISSKHSHFEVFKKKITPICLSFENRLYSETIFKEVYPKDNDFGVTAWSCLTLEKALKRL